MTYDSIVFVFCNITIIITNILIEELLTLENVERFLI